MVELGGAPSAPFLYATLCSTPHFSLAFYRLASFIGSYSNSLTIGKAVVRELYYLVAI